MELGILSGLLSLSVLELVDTSETDRGRGAYYVERWRSWREGVGSSDMLSRNRWVRYS